MVGSSCYPHQPLVVSHASNTDPRLDVTNLRFTSDIQDDKAVHADRTVLTPVVGQTRSHHRTVTVDNSSGPLCKLELGIAVIIEFFHAV